MNFRHTRGIARGCLPASLGMAAAFAMSYGQTTSHPMSTSSLDEEPAVSLKVLNLSKPLIDEKTPGMEGVKFGNEGGEVVKDRRGTYHWFTSEQFGDQLHRWQPFRQRMSVPAMRAKNHILRLQLGANTDRDRFLSNIRVTRTVDKSALMASGNFSAWSARSSIRRIVRISAPTRSTSKRRCAGR